MKNLNGWAKVVALIVAIGVQLMVLSNNNGRRDEAISNLKDGQKEIKDKLDAAITGIERRDARIDGRINSHIEKHGK
jgi:hypothetical protein